jgi:hypothetical protein
MSTKHPHLGKGRVPNSPCLCVRVSLPIDEKHTRMA